MLTVESLTSELGLKLAAGREQAAEREIRWVHISELQDPTPWLSGGELLLTTGIQLEDADRQTELVRLLAGREVAGLGFGTGFNHAKLPKALVKEAEEWGLPLFEVPYKVPFIQITEAAANRLVNEQYDVLSRGIAVNERLERLVLEGGGLARDRARDRPGDRGQLRGPRRQGRDRSPTAAGASAPSSARRSATRSRAAGPPPRRSCPPPASCAGRTLAHPVSPRGGDAEAWLVVVRRSGELGDFERLCVQQAAIVVALELMRERVARDTERRLSGEILDAALSGRMRAADVRDRLAPFGIGDGAAALVFSTPDPDGAQAALEQHFHSAGRPGAGRDPAGGPPRARLRGGRGRRVRPDRDRGRRRARRSRAPHGPVRAAASRPAGGENLRHSFHEARCALEATRFANGAAPDVASHRDLGAFTLLLSVQDSEALRLYCESVLGPIENSDERYAGELLRSLEAYIDRNGHWEKAASDCFCHRHTLRYRIKRVEELTGRDLGRANDRVEMWLALRAKELISA